jgi:hypothetical protein
MKERSGMPVPKFFRSPVHCAKLASDGLLYVCDRSNNRVQIFLRERQLTGRDIGG